MKPIIKYRGGKSKEIPQIIQYFPQFEGRYIEPFFGGGAMFFHIEPNNAIINDHCCPEKFYHKVGCSTEPASGTLTGVVG